MEAYEPQDARLQRQSPAQCVLTDLHLDQASFSHLVIDLHRNSITLIGAMQIRRPIERGTEQQHLLTSQVRCVR